LVDWCERHVRAAWRWLRPSNLYWFLAPDAPVQARPVSRAPALTDSEAGDGRASKKAALEELLRAAAAAPDLLLARRVAMAQRLIGAGVAKAW
jgi:hypothetical protein